MKPTQVLMDEAGEVIPPASGGAVTPQPAPAGGEEAGRAEPAVPSPSTESSSVDSDVDWDELSTPDNELPTDEGAETLIDETLPPAAPPPASLMMATVSSSASRV
mgnify:CR=1 FL=1